MKKQDNTVISAKEILNILPHRYPFVLVDKIVHLDLKANQVVGQKNVTVNEAFFPGHFPGAPIMPGVLIIEAMAQTGGILVHQKGYVDKIAVLLNIAVAKFRRPVLPGAILMLHVNALHISANGGKMKAKALIDEEVAVEAEFSFALIAKSAL